MLFIFFAEMLHYIDAAKDTIMTIKFEMVYQ